MVQIGGPDAGDYSFQRMLPFPIILQPGHSIGEGALKVLFAPLGRNPDRDRLGTLSVTYVSDPVTGATTTLVPSTKMCGEAVRTGARVLVTGPGNIPLAKVEKVQLQRITGNRNKPIVDSVDNAMNLPLVTVTPASPCGSFQYHREYGTVSNPIQLLPGSYQVTVTAVVGGKRKSKTVAFDVTTCDFNPTVVVNLQ